MSAETYFLVYGDGRVKRKVIHTDFVGNFWRQMPMKLAAEANQIIKQTPYGRGYTVKNRYSEKKQYFTKDEMVMLSLKAEPA